ncbi:MAG: hypothetical protein GC189_11035 [Alphaproteobacteria bacterium]|nr:hypothetical protein [Alphaproteobacteria bacterium]
MRTPNSRPARLTPVDEENRIRPVGETLDSRRFDPMLEERLLRAQFKRERSSAYWFAATKWGILGLVLGMCLGAYMMYVASVSSLPVAMDAMSRGAAIQDARSQLEDAAGLNQPAP